MAEELVIPEGTDTPVDQPVMVDVPPPHDDPTQEGHIPSLPLEPPPFNGSGHLMPEPLAEPATEEPGDEPTGDHILLQEIQEQEEHVRDLKEAWEGKKEDAKKAKDRFDAGIDDLCNLIRQSRASDTPLLNGIPPIKPASPPPPKEPAPPEAPADESWRIVRLADVLSGLPKSIPTACEEAGLTTVGELADYTAGGKLLTDIAGIGPAKAEKIEQALEGFWARRKEYETPLDIAPDDGTATAEAVESTKDAQEEEKDGNGPEADPD